MVDKEKISTYSVRRVKTTPRKEKKHPPHWEIEPAPAKSRPVIGSEGDTNRGS